MHYRWHYLLLQACGLLSVRCEPTQRYSTVDNIADFLSRLGVDPFTALNITQILSSYDDGRLIISTPEMYADMAMCMFLLGSPRRNLRSYTGTMAETT